MKNNKFMVLLLIGSMLPIVAYYADSKYDSKRVQAKKQANVEREQKKLQAKTKKQQAKVSADTQYKKTKIETGRQKELADIEYKRKAGAADIQADRAKVRATGVNVYGSDWRDNVANADSALSASDVSLFR